MNDDFTYAPYGPWGRVLCALPSVLALVGVVATLLVGPRDDAGAPLWAERLWGVAMCAAFGWLFSKTTYAVVRQGAVLEFYLPFSVRREPRASRVSVFSWVWWSPGYNTQFVFGLPGPVWRLPFVFMQAFTPWLLDHDPYLIQLRRFLEALPTLDPETRIAAFMARLPPPPKGLRSKDWGDGATAYSPPKWQLDRLLLNAFLLLLMLASWAAVAWLTLTILAPPGKRLLQLFWIVPWGALVALWLWSLLRSSMKVTLGKQLVLKRIVGSATVRWERITALRDGGFRSGGLTYLPGCGYAKLQYVGEDGRSRSLVIPPVFWLSDEFRKALLPKLEERGRPGLVIE